VTLEFDEDSADPYGRALAYVWVSDLGGELFNETLVREGLARVVAMAPNDKYEERFPAAEKEARGEGLGVWATDPCSTPERTTVPPPRAHNAGIPPPERTMLKSGGSAHGPLPLLPGGGCAPAYPVERDGACHR